MAEPTPTATMEILALALGSAPEGWEAEVVAAGADQGWEFVPTSEPPAFSETFATAKELCAARGKASADLIKAFRGRKGTRAVVLHAAFCQGGDDEENAATIAYLQGLAAGSNKPLVVVSQELAQLRALDAVAVGPQLHVSVLALLPASTPVVGSAAEAAAHIIKLAAPKPPKKKAAAAAATDDADIPDEQAEPEQAEDEAPLAEAAPPKKKRKSSKTAKTDKTE